MSVGILRCILEGDARARFRPRRISLVYETEASNVPRPLGLRFFPKDNLRLFNFNPSPLTVDPEGGYRWVLHPRERFLNGKRRYIYSLMMSAHGNLLHSYADYVITGSREWTVGNRKLIAIDLKFQFEGLRNYRIVMGPLPEVVEVESQPEGALRHWGVRGYGELYFLIYDNLQERLRLCFGLPAYYNITIVGRIEGVVESGYERLKVELEELEERVEKRFEVIAYMDDLLL